MDYKGKFISLINDKTLPLKQRKKLEEIYNSVVESEDERIRTFLHHTFTAQYLCKDKLGKWHGEPVVNILSWLEKQGEQKPTEKVEPKFKVGDCIKHNKANIICKIISVNSDSYYVENIETNFRVELFNAELSFHLWTIRDAKDGDVLWHSDTASNGIFIFKEIRHDGKVLCYCDYDSEDHFCIGEYHTCCWSNDKSIKPATKDQCDHLFEKMKESDYEWDAENKQLRKIEQKPDDMIESKFKVGNWYQCIKDFFGKGVTFDKNTAYYCAKEGCLQNEYGCHIAIVKDLYDNFKLWTIQDAKDGDILYSKEHNLLWLYKDIEQCYFCINLKYDNNISIDIDMVIPNDVCPANKEQHDLLFSKMKEACYDWDANKKKLKKIEKQDRDKEINNFDVLPGLYKCVHRMFAGTPDGKLLFEVGNIYKCLSKHDRAEFEVSYGHSIYLEDPVVCKHFIPFENQGEQKPTWSEEDENFFANICSIIDTDKKNFTESAKRRCKDWLKSLKDRV